MRMVCDTRNQVLVLFGGDAQSHYLADTWLYDLKTRTWRAIEGSGGSRGARRALHGLRSRDRVGADRRRIQPQGSGRHVGLRRGRGSMAKAPWPGTHGILHYRRHRSRKPIDRSGDQYQETRRHDVLQYSLSRPNHLRIQDRREDVCDARAANGGSPLSSEAAGRRQRRLNRIRRSTQGSGNQAEHSAGEPMGASFRSREDRACPHLGIGHVRHQPGPTFSIGVEATAVTKGAISTSMTSTRTPGAAATRPPSIRSGTGTTEFVRLA